jgi:hypothetical protein
VFKTDPQIAEIIDDAKAYYYEHTQGIGDIVEVGVDKAAVTKILVHDLPLRNMIKAAEFIGSNNEDNNKLVDGIQKIIQTPVLSRGYVQSGYWVNGYA